MHTAKILSGSFVEICEIYNRRIFQEHVSYVYRIAYLGDSYDQNELRLLFPGKNCFYIKLICLTWTVENILWTNYGKGTVLNVQYYKLEIRV